MPKSYTVIRKRAYWVREVMHIEEGERLMESWQANLGTGDEVYWNDPDEGICSGHAKFIGHMSYVDGVSVIVKDGIKMQVFTKELS